MREDGEEKRQVPDWPDDPDGGLDDPDRARTIQTPVQTIRLTRPEDTRSSHLKLDHPDHVPDHPEPARTSRPPADIRTCTATSRVSNSSGPPPGSSRPARIIRLHPRIIRLVPTRACWAEPMYPFAPNSIYRTPSPHFET